MTLPAVFAFECSVSDAPWGEHWQLINAPSRGAAKVHYWRQVRDVWPDIPYTAVRCRKKGPAESDAAFKIGVAYRGIPDTRCGDGVSWRGGEGVVVGFGGGGAWLEVIQPNGMRGYVHPMECYEFCAPQDGQP
jgi:hypothetical protein